MKKNGTGALIVSLALFVLYFSNVALGAAGLGGPLGDVPEMLTLFASSLFFVAGVLAREAAASRDADATDTAGEENL